jgi:hypothetical protein
MQAIEIVNCSHLYNLENLYVDEKDNILVIFFNKEAKIETRYNGKIIESTTDLYRVYDPIIPQYMSIKDNIIYIKDPRNNYTRTLYNSFNDRIKDKYIYNGNIFLEFYQSCNLLCIPRNNTKKTFFYNSLQYLPNSIIILRKAGKLNKYSVINMHNVKESHLMTTYNELSFSYCDNKTVLYYYLLDEEFKAVILDRETNKEVKNIILPINGLSCIKYGIFSTGDSKTNYYSDLINKKDYMSNTQKSEQQLRFHGIDENYSGIYRFKYLERFGEHYYAEVTNYSLFYSKKDYIVRLGRCCICSQLNPRGIYCESSNIDYSKFDADVLYSHYNERSYYYCEYTYRDLIYMIMQKAAYPICTDIIRDIIYNMLFGSSRKIEHKFRFEKLVHMYNYSIKYIDRYIVHPKYGLYNRNKESIKSILVSNNYSSLIADLV